jgi:hypothetical protein
MNSQNKQTSKTQQKDLISQLKQGSEVNKQVKVTKKTLILIIERKQRRY